MKKLLFLLLFVTLPLKAQTGAATGIGMHQQCHAQACYYSSWEPNRAGDTLIAITYPQQKAPLPCESTAAQCGGGLVLVTDFNGNHWQSAFPYGTGGRVAIWYALNVKAGTNIVGVVASRGYGGGDFSFNVIIAEYPPAIGVDVSSWNQYFKGEGDDEPNAGPITTTERNDLLIGYSINLAFNGSKGPLVPTPSPDANFTIENDDGFLSMADRIAYVPGVYNFGLQYNGYCLWEAGVLALKMGTPIRPCRFGQFRCLSNPMGSSETPETDETPKNSSTPDYPRTEESSKPPNIQRLSKSSKPS